MGSVNKTLAVTVMLAGRWDYTLKRLPVHPSAASPDSLDNSLKKFTTTTTTVTRARQSNPIMHRLQPSCKVILMNLGIIISAYRIINLFDEVVVFRNSLNDGSLLLSGFCPHSAYTCTSFFSSFIVRIIFPLGLDLQKSDVLR